MVEGARLLAPAAELLPFSKPPGSTPRLPILPARPTFLMPYLTELCGEIIVSSTNAEIMFIE